MGTNDLGNRAPYNNIISDFGNLIGICKQKKPSIQLVVSAILPRPVDLDSTDNVRRNINDYLQKSMSKSMKGGGQGGLGYGERGGGKRGRGGGKWGERGREAGREGEGSGERGGGKRGERVREAGIGYPPVHPHL